MNIWEQIKGLEEEAIQMKNRFHVHPELSDQEDWTCEEICKFLADKGIEHVNVPKGGVLGFIHGSGGHDRAVLLRADVDALPIDEDEMNLSQTKEAVSSIRGVCHACGHDAHTTMLLYAAEILNDHKDLLQGNVVLMFERGEEKTINCTRLFHWLETHHVQIDSSFGIHIHPELESGKVAINDGPVMASNVCFDVKIKGEGGHGSRPDLAHSPIDCFVAVYQALSAFRMNHISPFRPLTLSVGYLQAGKTNNVIPDELIFKGSSRFFDRDDGINFKKHLTRILDSVTATYGCTYDYLLLRGPCFPVVNHLPCASMVRECLSKMIGAERVCQCEPKMGSESFARTMKMWPGVFALLGTGNEEKGTGAPIHTSQFDVDNSVLKYGIAAHVCYAIGFLQSDIHVEKYNGSFADMYRQLMLPEDQIQYLDGKIDKYTSV